MSGRRGLILLMLVGLGLIVGPRMPLSGGFAGLGDDAEGYAEVRPHRGFSFPADHGAHPGYRIEWWYLTANLADADGNAYGIQWTLFRSALAPGLPSAGFSNHDVWMGHAAVTTASTHYVAEALARGGIGQAGVTSDPFQAWIDDWSFTGEGANLSKARVTARGKGFSYRLDLATDRPIVLHGDQGFSRKSEQGQASYYYSQPFFAVAGGLNIEGRSIQVTGSAWMDREWSSQPLSGEQAGWEWFSLHLDSGEKLMVFRLRGKDETHFHSGTWIGSGGEAAPLTSSDISMESLAERTVAGRLLPTQWRVRVASHALDVTTQPLNPSAWMATVFPYWEGPIRFAGSHGGTGYLEMTGY